MKYPAAENTSENANQWDDYFVCREDLSPGSAVHLRLFDLARALPSDFEPYGQQNRGG